MVVSGTFVFSVSRKMSALLKEAVEMELFVGVWLASAGQLLIGAALIVSFSLSAVAKNGVELLVANRNDMQGINHDGSIS